jgi:hypothetical protein
MGTVKNQNTARKQELSTEITSPQKTKIIEKEKGANDSLMMTVKKDSAVSEVKIKGDTIAIVIAGWSFYYPFGKFTDLKKLTTISSGLRLRDEIDKKDPNDPIQLYRVYTAHSYVKFIKGDETGRFELVSGEITEPDIYLENGTKIGMSKEAFCNIYFKHKIDDKLSKINVIEFITGLDGLWNYYTFKGNKLCKIKFVSDYQVDQK